jgi:hypothetical protein
MEKKKRNRRQLTETGHPNQIGSRFVGDIMTVSACCFFCDKQCDEKRDKLCAIQCRKLRQLPVVR